MKNNSIIHTHKYKKSRNLHEKWVKLTIFFTGLSIIISALQASFLHTNLNLKHKINISWSQIWQPELFPNFSLGQVQFTVHSNAHTQYIIWAMEYAQNNATSLWNAELVLRSFGGLKKVYGTDA